MTIRWGVSPIAWANDDMPELGKDTSLETILNDAREIGFEGVELGSKFPTNPDVLAPIMREHEMELIGGWYSSNLLLRSAEEEIAAMADHLTLLARMDCNVFIIAETSNAVHCNREDGRLSSPPRLAPGEWAEFGRRLDKVATHVNKCGLRFAYHHHLGTVVEQSEDLENFLASTGDHVGLVLDTGHALYGNIDPVDVVRTHPERVNHVHCKDIRTERFRRFYAEGVSFLDGVIGGMFTVPGDGDYDYAPLMKALAEIDYSGWIVVEAEQDPAIANPRKYAQIGLDTLKQLATEMDLVR
ncbi:myo-inosose-2 dehydratase [Rhizorhapis suberifaciens]|nr:myo-inosose-2 dehydratase [Rhizorhapis suberifaciens]